MLDFLKTIFVPALISLALYLVVTYGILPVIRRHRQRYAQYLPLSNISERTSSLREHLSDALMDFFLPSSWRHRQVSHHHRGSIASDEGLFEEEEGENMVGFDIDESRRGALEQRRSSRDTDRRLSRDLEEGFKDDSEDEDRDADSEDESVHRA